MKALALVSVPELKAMKSVRNRTDLIFAPTDKGMAVAVMEKESYHGKVISLLEDGKASQKLPDNPTPKQQQSLNTRLSMLKRAGRLGNQDYN